ncbi:MAG: DegT/DnrJ/EryC1/StrS family aminotransferase [Elusimicrobiota bacterium]
MKDKIQMVDLGVQHRALEDEIFKKWKELCDSTSFILGEEVQKFEQEFAEFCGTEYAVGVSSGTSALHVALEAVGCRDKEVVSTPFTFIATSEAIVQAGGNIKWVDIHPDYYTVAEDELEKSVNSNTGVILPVHIYGHPAPMDKIMELAETYDCKVIEDCAQSHGAKFKGRKTGSIGDLGCFSFYPGKNMGAYGDAGCVVTDDEELARKVRNLRAHGAPEKYYHTDLGFNYRLDALQAAVLRIKLKHLKKWNESRRKIAELYTRALEDTPLKLPQTDKDSIHVFHQYSILTEKREELSEKLEKDGIATAMHYPIPLHLQPSFEFMELGRGTFPVAEKVASRCLSLPMYPELSEEKVNYITDKIKEFYE